MNSQDLDTKERRIDVAERDGAVVVSLRGKWTLHRRPVDYERTIGAHVVPGSRVVFDVSGVKEWDTTLVAFLFDVYRHAKTDGYELDVETLPVRIQKLLRMATAVPEKDTGDEESKPSILARVGIEWLKFERGVTTQLEFLGEVALSFGRLLVGRSSMRAHDFLNVVQQHGPGAAPIVSLICFLVGLIVAFLGSVVLTQFGAGIYNAQLVGFGMFRELGALMAGIIMVGRSGAAFAAEIGSMKVSEELDAYATFGISSIDFIVLPRMLALFLMMPLLTVLGDMVGVLGGLIVSATVMDISPRLFLGNLFGSVGINDFAIGIIKGTVFGALIALFGCLRGMQCGNSADEVGRATTSSVVTGITAIIAANAVIDWLASIL